MTSLSERTVLARLSTGVWSGKLHDAVVTEEVREKHKAEKGAGTYTKQIISQKYLGIVGKAGSRAAATHRTLTLPWEDGGTRILSTNCYMSYTDAMRRERLAFASAVDQFMSVFDEAKAEAKARLKDMFDEDDYPDERGARAKFSFDVEISKVPVAGDFRAELSDESVASIVKDIERRTNDRLNRAVNDSFERVKDVVEKMVERLKADDNKFRDSLVWNVKETAELLPLLNITNDQRITQLSDRMLSELIEQPEILRADTNARKQTARSAEDILRKVKQYMAS
jgi:hypothetical protein